ncbi:MAG: ribose-5-phosphate isomerase RpiA [Polyangiaceae bacterium]
MSQTGPDPADLDRVAQLALERVTDGMILGLGTGRAAEAFIRRLGERTRRGLQIQGVPTSKRSEELARRENIRVVTLEEIDRIDIAFDGADEVTPELHLTKGLGGALLRERVVAYEAEVFVVLVTPEKLVEKLGARTVIPVELVPFAASTIQRHLKRLGGTVTLRQKQGGLGPFMTDNQNWIFDVKLDPIDDPALTDAKIRAIPGVVDTGIFLGMADYVLVGEPGTVRTLKST